MNEAAIILVKQCLRNQSLSLNLRGLGLNDSDWEKDSILSKLLGQCVQLEKLDITHNHLTEIKGLETLINLRELHLSGNKIKEIKNIEALVKLEELYLNNNELKEIRCLETLVNLKLLYLNGNNLNEVKGLRSIVNLEYLYLDNNQIDEINGLGMLTKLQLLKLSQNHLAEIKGLETLINLQRLYINENRITEIKGLEALKKLELLNLNGNRITEIKGLEALCNLKLLLLGENQIKEINGLDTLTNLMEFKINNNNVSEINGLKNLRSLRKLDISTNQIREIKGFETIGDILSQLKISYNRLSNITGIETLINLQQLDISNNNILHITPLLPLLQRKKNPLQLIIIAYLDEVNNNYINVYGNPLATPPIEVIRQGQAAVLRYFTAVLEPAYEAKLLLVGEPEAGKTSLIKKLINETYLIPNEEDSTVGIQVAKWTCRLPTILEPIKLNIWDFGGQEMQYLTHQFFLSSDALYILLTSARKDFDNLDYWLNIISLLGKNENNQNSELLVVANEIRMQEGQIGKTFDEKKYRKLYPHLPFKFHTVNLATAFDVDGRFITLKSLIKEKLVTLPVMGRQLPVKWGIVRKQLTERNINYISITEYLDLCKKANVEKQFALDLSNYLHKIGEVVYFQNDQTVDSFVILKPQWAVDGIYSILKTKEIESSGGHFKQKQVYDIWEKDGYSAQEKSMLLNLMAKDSFEVAYKIPSKKDEYIAPQLLPFIQPDYEWDKTDILHFRYLYPFMPKGIITRLIVRLHENIKNDMNDRGLVWRSGVILEKLGCTAKVEETKIMSTGQQIIAIEVTGHASHQSLLLYDICHTIEGIHRDAFSNIEFDRQVPCNCAYCKNLQQPGFFEYKELMQYIDNGVFEIRCKLKPISEPNIASLLKGIFNMDFTMIDKDAINSDRVIIRNKAVSEDPFGINRTVKKTKKLFISYSKHDEKYKDELRKHLITLKEEKLISSFDCKQIELGADWNESIQQEIDQCDIMICLISVHFLNNDYISKYEVDKAIAKGKQLIPIIITHCDWENSNIGKLYTPLRGKSISINEELLLHKGIRENTDAERAFWWTAIIKEMREKLFS